ncbi:MAG: 2-phospho-L-lactate transferase CofD family protein, partial [Armatimonadota bacterium]
VQGIADALAKSRAVRIFVCNVMTQPGETDDFRASDHIRAINKHADAPIFDYVIVNDERPDEKILQRYRTEGQEFVESDVSEIARMGYLPVSRHLLSQDDWARHDPDRLAALIMDIVREEEQMGL